MSEELIGQFTPESFGEWCRGKFDRFTADPHTVLADGDFAKAEVVGYVQALPDVDVNRPLLVMAVCAGDQINERSSRRKQFDFARKQLQAAIDKPPAKVKGLFAQGLFAFYDNAGAFRLSLVSGRADGKKLVYSDFKRQSFFITQDRNKTFQKRMASPFSSYQNLSEAFSVEALTREFYNNLFTWYERAMAPESKVTFPNDLARDDDDRDLLAEHIIRLITRLMFVWFIRQKDLVPEKLFDANELKGLLKDFDPLSPKQDHYYRAILQNLFFATLNCEIKERDFAVESGGEENKEHYGIKLLYRYRDEFACSPDEVIKLFRPVPFLNGGLFECLDKKHGDSARSPVLYHDGFSREPKKRAHVPNNLFFDDEGLITLFARYDFTVDENSPNDTDVALDPELLGKVFENLLGAYNPETKQTARKQSGSFYTPREIVNYMVDESLVAHLRTKVPEAEESTIRMLLSEENPANLPESLKRKLVEAIYHCRILDPACGSGAFPMGLLLKMVRLLHCLDPKNTLWHEVVMAETEKALAEAETLNAAEKRQRRQRITDSFDQNVNQPDYARKLYLIENCIFGVDIQSIAVQISKLRAFITLVCDQKPDPNDVAGNYGMLPLPNLETKFVAANSLIGLTADFADGLQSVEGGSRLDDDELVRLRAELAEVRHQHFRARTAQDKNACRKQDRDLRGRIKARLVEIAGKPDAAKIARYQAEIESLRNKRKAVEAEDWRDVVQSKPAQDDMFHPTPTAVQTAMRVDVNKEKRDSIDYEIDRLTRLIEAEENRSKNKSAFQKEADRLAAWDPYDQNISSPFFDLEWMFGFKGGFDVVIGNPPYVRADEPSESNRGQRKAIMDSGSYETLWEKWDLFVPFIERSYKLLKQNGVTTLIVSDAFCHSKYAQKPQNWFLQNARILRLDFCGEIKIFDAAVHNLIYLVQKADGARNKPERRLHACEFGIVTVLPTDEQAKLTCRAFTPQKEQSAVFVIPTLEIGTICYVSFGCRPNSDEKRAKGLFVAADLVSEKKDKSHPKRYIEAKDIGKWVYDQRRWLEWGTKRSPALLTRPTFQELYEVSEKIVAADVSGAENRAAYDVEKVFHSHTLISFVPWHLLSGVCNNSLKKSARYKGEKPRPDLPQREELEKTSRRFAVKFLLALMNSSVARHFLRANRRSNIHLYPDDWKKLPIPDVSKEEQVSIIKLVDNILDAKRTNPNADIGSIESEIDRLVYALYNLTANEIAKVEGRESGAKQTAAAAKPVKAAVVKKPRKSVMTDDPDLA